MLDDDGPPCHANNTTWNQNPERWDHSCLFLLCAPSQEGRAEHCCMLHIQCWREHMLTQLMHDAGSKLVAAAASRECNAPVTHFQKLMLQQAVAA